VTTEVARPNAFRRVATFYQEVVGEMKKVTWPDRTQVRQLSIGVIALSLFIGAVIALLDVIFAAVFVRGIPALIGS